MSFDEMNDDDTERRIPGRHIRILPSVLANQIAAGEVVERPASVAKELLENSLDAGARRIEVEVERGGTRLIRVRDDGEGIHPEDLALALSRHATSKVGSLDDLERVASLGFRGEALPSIASVSRLTLISREASSETGWRVSAEAREPSPLAHPLGTTVEVRDLFFNTPARRKFLRTERTEFRHIDAVARRIALSRPELGLTLHHNGRRLLSVRAARTEAESLKRLARLCGAGFVEHALQIDFEAGHLCLRGFVGSPGSARPQADLQHFFVNGRAVHDSVVGHAIRQGYQGLLPQGRYPAYVLYLELDPREVDVNVHPTKHEVRFRESRLIHDFVLRALREALGGGRLDRGGAGVADAEAMGAGVGSAGVGSPGVEDSSPRSAADAGGRAPQHGPERAGAELRPRGRSSRDEIAGYAALHGPESARHSAPPGVASPRAGPLGQPLGVLRGRYVLAENAEGLLLIDMAAARRALARQRLTNGLRSGGVQSQPLLLPITVRTSVREAEILERHAELARRLGFDWRQAGPASLSLRGIPAPLGTADPEGLARALVGALERRAAQAQVADERGDESLCARLARHVVIAGERGFDRSELDELLRELERMLADPGRADASRTRGGIVARISMEEIETRLRRGEHEPHER